MGDQAALAGARVRNVIGNLCVAMTCRILDAISVADRNAAAAVVDNVPALQFASDARDPGPIYTKRAGDLLVR